MQVNFLQLNGLDKFFLTLRSKPIHNMLLTMQPDMGSEMSRRSRGMLELLAICTRITLPRTALFTLSIEPTVSGMVDFMMKTVPD